MNDIRNIFIYIAITLFFISCASIPQDALKLNVSSLKLRSLQTRAYEANDMEILRAGIGVLQDLGFNVDKTEKTLGVITASKTRDARETGQMVGVFLLAILAGASGAQGGNYDYDTTQNIRVGLVITKGRDKSKLARVSFHRVVYGTQNNVRKLETIKDEDIYSEFFQKLDKALFLEGSKI